MIPKSLRPLAPYLWKYRSELLVGFICVLLTNGIWILFPQIIRFAIDSLQGGVTRELLLKYALALLGVAVAKGIFQFLTRWILIGVSRDIDRKSTRLNSSHLKLSRMPSSA